MYTKFLNRRFFKIITVSIFSLNTFFLSKAEIENTAPVLNQTINTNAISNQPESKPSSPWFRKDRWAITIDIGGNFKQIKFKDEEILHKEDGFADKKNGRKFWGESGISASYGLSYKRVFENKKWFWGSRIVWTWFFPDQRYNEKGTEIALSFVPVIGNYIKTTFKNAPGWLTMLVVPIVYFDFGYITDNNISFSLGSVYVWGLSPTVEMPIVENVDLEIRSVIFLDKIIAGIGYHNFLMSIGLNWKPWNY